jgi:hypothetical protein
VTPHEFTPGGASGPDRGHRRIRVGGEPFDQPADRRIRGHRTEQLGLGADHRDISQTVPTERDRNG